MNETVEIRSICPINLLIIIVYLNEFEANEQYLDVIPMAWYQSQNGCWIVDNKKHMQLSLYFDCTSIVGNYFDWIDVSVHFYIRLCSIELFDIFDFEWWVGAIDLALECLTMIVLCIGRGHVLGKIWYSRSVRDTSITEF